MEGPGGFLLARAIEHDEAFHQLQPWLAAAHLRDLLMTCGLLPLVDKQVSLFERWLGNTSPASPIPSMSRSSLADRDLRPADARQAEIDVWHAEHKQHERVAVRAFCCGAWTTG